MGNNILCSNDRLYLDHYDAVFETLWKKGIDIRHRRKDVEEGYNVDIETIPNPIESLKFYRDITNSKKRNIDNAGIFFSLFSY